MSDNTAKATKADFFGLGQKQYNCGGVILFNTDFTQTILVKSHFNHHSFPKGKREKGENLYKTATRETEEETGLTPNQYVLSDYMIGEYKNVTSKTPSVLYFIGQVAQEATTFTYDQAELKNVSWTTITDALDMPDDIFVEKRRLLLKKALEEVQKPDFKFYSSEMISKSNKLGKNYPPKELTPEDLYQKKLKGFSKTVSWVLRHGAIELGLDIDPEGYVLVDQLLGIEELTNLTKEILKEVVDTNNKQRFKMVTRDNGDSDNGESYIRANQGHSMAVGRNLNDQKMMKKITLEDGIDKAYHGTSLSSWKFIENEGLRPMDRKHCHLSRIYKRDGQKDGQEISGIRGHSQVILEIDLKQCLQNGIEFFLSDNDVILTPGPIPASLISLKEK